MTTEMHPLYPPSTPPNTQKLDAVGGAFSLMGQELSDWAGSALEVGMNLSKACPHKLSPHL